VRTPALYALIFFVGGILLQTIPRSRHGLPGVAVLAPLAIICFIWKRRRRSGAIA
jgi:hypothetical protein